jgi:hypothetical protein
MSELLEGLFRSPRFIQRANGPHEVRSVPSRLFARCGLAWDKARPRAKRRSWAGLGRAGDVAARVGRVRSLGFLSILWEVFSSWPRIGRPLKVWCATVVFPQPTQLIFYPRRVDPMWYVADASNINRRQIEMRHYLAMSVLCIVVALANPCGAQTPPSGPPVQNQAIQTPEADPNAGVSGQANVGPTSVPISRGGSSTSSGAGKSFGSAGRGLPGMPSGPPIKGSMGYQDPSSRYMRPPAIPPLSCDPAINIPC